MENKRERGHGGQGDGGGQNGQPLEVLLIEDNTADEYVVRRMLHEAPVNKYRITTVSDQAAALDALVQPFDVCLLDYDLGAYTALSLLNNVDAADLAGPVILITGHDDFQIDQGAMDSGVTDHIAKSEMRSSMLDRTIRYARHRFLDQQRLNFLAHHDALTGLLNRHAFLQRLETWLHSPMHKSSEIYLLYIDLDGFKAVNDTWGHDIGDQVLRHAAESVRRCMRATDLLARYGGDELVAAVSNIDEQAANTLTNKILQRLRTPASIGDLQIVATASIGIARAHHAPKDADELIRLADHAMFAAKHAGRDTARMFSDQIAIPQRDRGELESHLRSALEQGQLELCFQPIVDMYSREIKGAEALARWTHPTLGAISPTRFVALAEECGLIRQLTLWSLETALAALTEWQKTSTLPADFRLAVNISPPQLLDPDFPALLQSLLDKYAIPRRLLRLEITENFFVHKSAAQALKSLTQDGLSLALDDFGTGYSSLSMLTQLPIDTLKIDRSFVDSMGGDPRAEALIRSLITLGTDMGMTIIAEGVETEAQHQQLIDYGCRIGQGYLYAYPGNHAALAGLLAIGAQPIAAESPE